MLGVYLLVMGVSVAQLPTHVTEAKATVPGGFIEMFVATVMPTNGSHTVVLVNPHEELLLPVGVALPEAVAIYGRLEHQGDSRPKTRDLLGDVVTGLGARVLRVQINDVVDGTFLGTVVVQGRSGPPFSIDARAADALVLALSAQVPIYVAKPVMERAALSREDVKRMPGPTGSGGGSGGGSAVAAEGSARVFDL